jgi:nucleoside-diphosphate-sugar epimerase
MKVIITGSTGMVGKAVLLECIDSLAIDHILLINRKSLGNISPKVEELIVDDYDQLAQHADRLTGYDACYHCMGVSALGLSEEQYTRLTLAYTQQLADVLYDHNPDMTFIYVSGKGTDSSEEGSVMWARIKGKTENYILHKGFKDAYAFRPGGILPEKGVKSRTAWYNAIYVLLRPFFPILKTMKSITRSTYIGKAMINLSQREISRKILEPENINEAATLTREP